MKYYRIFSDVEHPNRWWLGIPRLPQDEEVDVWLFWKGIRLSLDDLLIPIEHEGDPLDLTWAPFDILIGSMRCAETIERLAHENVQFVRAHLPTGEDMAILNILSIIDCIDHEHSHMTYYPPNYYRKDLAGKPQSVFSLVINSAQVRGQHLFRVADIKTAIIISEELLMVLQRQKYSGFTVVAEVGR